MLKVALSPLNSLSTFGKRVGNSRLFKRSEVLKKAVSSVSVKGLESLENRTMLSVTLDSQGWTVFGPSSDTRTVYVSSSAGNDANSGLSSSAPVRSLSKAKSLMRNGMPDQMLLKRGDTWNESLGVWSIAGRSEQERAVISTYGTGNRPVINSGSGNGISLWGNGSISNLGISGIAFRGSGTSAGVFYYNDGSNITLEDVDVQNYGTNMAIQGESSGLHNFKLRRSIIAGAHNNYSSGHSEGVYIDLTYGIQIEENVFDRNGWSGSRDSGGYMATIYNHNLYIQNNCGGSISLKGNIFANASSHGAQVRPGGVAEDNLFVANPISLLLGGGDDPTPGGVAGGAFRNVILDGGDINSGNARGWGIDLENSKSLKADGNVIAHDRSRTSDGHAIYTDGYGVSLLNNHIYQWRGGIDNNASGTVQSGNKIDAAGYPDPNRSVGSYNASLGGTNSLDAFLTQAKLQGRTNWRSQYTAAAVNSYIRAGFGIGQYTNPTPTPTPQPTPTDTTAPGANIGTANNVTAAGSTYDFTVTYSDGTALDLASIGTGDIKVTGPNGFNQVASYVSKTNSSDSKTATVTYRITAPGGSWDSADNGTYYIDLQGSQVKDAAGNYAAAKNLDYFLVSAPTQSTSDTTAPGKSASVGSVSTAGGTSHTFTVTFTDGVGLDLASIGAGDVRVTGPNGFNQVATYVSKTNTSDGKSATATYRITPPGGSWDAADNGTYTLVMEASQVRDTSGNFVSGGTLASFGVNITSMSPAPTPSSSVTFAGGASSDVAYDSTGKLHLVYFDLSTNKLMHRTRSTSGTWSSPVTIDSRSKAAHISLAIDKYNQPHVAYYDANAADLRYADFSGGSWQPAETLVANNTVGLNPSLTFDANGRAAVTYYNKTAGNLLLGRWDGSAWRFTTLASTGDVGVRSVLALSPATLKLVSAYQDTTNNQLRYGEETSSGWKWTTVDSVNMGGNHVSLAFDLAKRPAIAYYDATNGDLKFAHFNGSSWNKGVVTSSGSVGTYADLMFNKTTGKAEILYRDNSTNQAKKAVGDVGSWSISLVDEVGSGMATARSASGQIALASWNSVDNQLTVVTL